MKYVTLQAFARYIKQPSTCHVTTSVHMLPQHLNRYPSSFLCGSLSPKCSLDCYCSTRSRQLTWPVSVPLELVMFKWHSTSGLEGTGETKDGTRPGYMLISWLCLNVGDKSLRLNIFFFGSYLVASDPCLAVNGQMRFQHTIIALYNIDYCR